MSQLINKIHVNSHTKLSLNDRFTAMSSVKPRLRPNQARASARNLNLVQQLAQKHKVIAAKKLEKKKTLKAARPVNTRVGLRMPQQAARRITRSNSVSNISARIGVRRASLSAQRPRAAGGRGREANFQNNTAAGRSRSRSRSRAPSVARGNARSQSRTRNRSRSRSRSRARQSTPVKARLGFKTNNAAIAKQAKGNLGQKGVLRGRVAKNRNAGRPVAARKQGNVQQLKNAAANQRRGRSQQRNTNNQVAPRRGRSQSKQRAPRSASVQRKGGKIINKRTNNAAQGPVRRGRSQSKPRAPQGGKPQNGRGRKPGKQVPGSEPRGRSRTRNARGAPQQKPGVKREDLDKELDQYMANTNSDLDYIMGNT